MAQVKPAHIKTVQQFVNDHVLRHVREILDDGKKVASRCCLHDDPPPCCIHTQGVIHFYGLLDRGGNMAKRLFTSHKRDRPGLPDREGGKLTVPLDGLLPLDWESIVDNRGMASREIKPIFHRALIQSYNPPEGNPPSSRRAPPLFIGTDACMGFRQVRHLGRSARPATVQRRGGGD